MSKCELAKIKSQVGIFWWFQGKLIADATPLAKAEPYGDALTHPVGHVDYWSTLQERGAVPIEIEYEQPPRGRVGYNRKRKEFFMFADQCIIKDVAVVRAVITAFHLPDNTEPLPDSHYRCAECLSRGRHWEQD